MWHAASGRRWVLRHRHTALAASSAALLLGAGAVAVGPAARAPACASSAGPGGATTTDVLVVGGGIVGTAAAYYAAKAGGARVTLLERGSIASEASSLSAGTLACDGWGRDPERVGWFGVLCNGSMAIFRELEAIGHDCELRQDGALTIARNAAELKMCQREHANLAANGHDVAYLEGHDAVVAVEPALAGGDILAALHSRKAGHVNAAHATKGLADAAVALGATVTVGATVVGIERLPVGSVSRYRVTTAEAGAHECKALILAAGAWVRPL